MQLTARHEFADTCDRVYAMCVDPAFLAQACTELGALSHSEAVLPRASGAISKVTAQIAPPQALVRLIGPSVAVEQVMTWGEAAADGSRGARLTVSVAGFPVELESDARLAPTASGCAIDYDGTVTVKIPLLGASLEHQVAPFVLETLECQQRTGDAWLAARG